MAKKKEAELTYMQLPITSGQKQYKSIRLDWRGLNRQNPYDTGYISDEMNISTKEYPLLTPSPKPKTNTEYLNCTIGEYGKPICMFGFENFLLYVAMHYMEGDLESYELRITYVDLKTLNIYTHILDADASEANIDKVRRSIVQFNAFVKNENGESVLQGEYIKKLVVFPDKKSVDYNIPNQADDDNWITWDTIKGTELSPAPPDMDYITVYLSRVFGVKGSEIYASGFNDYTNWKTDIEYDAELDESGNITFTDGYDENNAWVSAVQSNTESNSDFTGITTFQGHVVAFKRDFMYEIYNTKNPFRVKEIYAEGCISNQSIQDVGGTLIFVSENGVFAYTGGKPRLLSNELKIDKFNEAVAGTDGRNYYLWCIYNNFTKTSYYVYDTYTGMWSQREIPKSKEGEETKIIDFAKTDYGIYMLCDDGNIYRIDSENDKDIYAYDGQKWYFETDFITTIASKAGTIDIKHIQKIQMYAKVDNTVDTNEFRIYALYDEEEYNPKASHLVFDSKGRKGNITVRVIPRKTACYKFRLRFEGTGYVEFRGLELITKYGGDVNVSEEH